MTTKLPKFDCPRPPPPPGHILTGSAAILLGVSRRALEQDRKTDHRGGKLGIPYVKIRRMIYYRLTDIESYLEAARQTPPTRPLSDIAHYDIWLVWAMDSRNVTALRDVATSAARASRVRKSILEPEIVFENDVRIVRVWIERRETNHTFGQFED